MLALASGPTVPRQTTLRASSLLLPVSVLLQSRETRGLVLDVPALSAGEDALPSPASRYRESFPATPRCAGIIRSQVSAVARESGMGVKGLGDVALAVSEAVSNALIHGSVGVKDAEVRVSVELSPGEMLVVIGDDGGGIRPRPDSPGAGLGLPIMASITERLDLQSSMQGTDVRMTFLCPSAT